MSVYVDDGFVSGDWGRWTGGGHMTADTDEELHAMAEKIGLKRTWFQRGSIPEHNHYDLTRNKRRQAIEAGAVSETWREAARRRRAKRAKK